MQHNFSDYDRHHIMFALPINMFSTLCFSLRVFGCAFYVPITPHYRRKLGPQRRLEIYVGFNSPSIIRYLEPTTSDLFTTRFSDCEFDESTFPILGEDNWKREASRKIDQIVMFIWPMINQYRRIHPYTGVGEKEVQLI